MIRRRTKLALCAAAGVLGTGLLLLPMLVENRLRAELVAHGFPDASLDVASVGFGHLQLRNVHLQPGVDLGSVRVTPGLAALWRKVDRVAISDARMSFDQLVKLGSNLKLDQTSKGSGSIDLSVEIRDPGRDGWSAQGTGQVTWGTKVEIAGQVDIDVPRLAAGPYELTDVHVPITLDARGMRVTGAHAKLAGGKVTLDAVAAPGAEPELTLHADGVQLAELLRPTRRVAGTGVVDGAVVVRIDERGPWITYGELRARQPGTLQVNDASLRERVAKTKSPFAVHGKVASALMDFKYTTLTLELSGPGDGPEVRLATRGQGRLNHQELDIAIGVRGVRDAMAYVLGGAR